MIIWVSGRGVTRYSDADLPLEIGGSTGDALLIRGVGDVHGAAVLASFEGRVHLRTTAAYEPVLVNDEAVEGSRFLAPGDTIRLGTTQIEVTGRPGELRMAVSEGARVTSPAAEDSDDEPLTPLAYRPVAQRVVHKPQRRVDPRLVALGVAAFVLAVLLWFSLTAVSVRIVTDPPADDIDLPRTLLKLGLGDRVLLRPGQHRLRAEREGYYPVETWIQVADDADQDLSFVMVKLPGWLDFVTTPPIGALVQVDGAEAGKTPLDPLELTPGTHRIAIQAERYLDWEQEIEIEGGGVEQTIEVELTPGWSEISVSSAPSGAVIRAGENEMGPTPVTFDLLAGEYPLAAELPGHKIWRGTLVVEANQPMTLPEIVLELADGRLTLKSEPSGARVSLGETLAGETPIDIDLSSGEKHTLTLFKRGYELAARDVQLESGETRELRVKLAPRFGRVELVVSPPDAQVKIGGKNVEPGSLRLLALPQRIVVSREGYAPATLNVTPRPGEPQRLEVRLLTVEEHERASQKREITTAQGHRLVLVEPGSFVMGTPKGEPGRRPNENPVNVELTRPFYIGVHEVTNEKLRAFKPEHRSRAYNGQGLDAPDQPATSVTWVDAVRYCNWLSAREGLPPAYVERAGRWVAARPMGNGYRLPTESEWAWAARFAGENGGRRYPWGDDLPPPTGSGNYADRSASSILANTMSAYNDGFAVSAPVGSANPNGAGLYDLGGNVAEWVQDFYTIYPRRSTGSLRNPMGPQDGAHHVIRGSSWMHWSVTQLRFAYRDYGTEGRVDVGFRIVRYVK
jgi:formylglycine-generating enzyme required for sulfatase activity